MNTPKTTPKEFFIYLAGFAALYVSAVSLISLLFTIINRVFPDALSGGYYYGDVYSSGMRIAIASLLIVFPIYVFLASYINKYLISNPDKKDLPVRKWLTYITLFLTSVAVVVDLVVLVNIFLGGEITIRFALKVMAVLLVAGSVFGYYLYDLRKTFSPDMQSRTKMIMALSCLLVFGSLIGGLFIIGSPNHARALRFDDRRISDLSSIQWQIVNYWQSKQEVPASLSYLDDPISSFMTPRDPETNEPYVYEKTGNASFKICATFSTSSEEDPRLRNRGGVTYPSKGFLEGDNWYHEEGLHCFDRTIDPDIYPTRGVTIEKKTVEETLF